MKIRNILFIAIMFMAFANTASAALIQDGLIAAYDFQEGVDPAVLYDISGNGNNGTLFGNTNWTAEGLIFDGSGDYVTLGDLGNFSTGFTIFTASRADANTFQAILSNAGSTTVANGSGFSIARSNTNDEYKAEFYHNVAPSYYSKAQTIKENTGWDVVSTVFNGTEGTLGIITGMHSTCLDYDKVDVPSCMVDNDREFYIGRVAYTSGWQLTGSVGYIAIYNRSMSKSEITYTQNLIKEELEERGIEILSAVEPCIVITLDDGKYSDYDNSVRIADNYNVPLTSYISAGLVGTTGTEPYMTWEEIINLKDRNYGVEDHTLIHSYLSSLTEEELISNFDSVDAGFLAAGLCPPEHISYPFGAFNALTLSIAPGYRDSGQGITDSKRRLIKSYNISGNEYIIRRQGVYKTSGENLTDTFAYIDSAIEGNYTVYLYTHVVTADSYGSYDCDIELFEELISYVAEKRDAGLITPLTVDGMYRATQGIRTTVISGNTLTGETTGATENIPVSNIGFVWGTTRLNNPEGSTPTNSGYGYYYIGSGEYSNTQFEHIISKPSGTFYYRAAAEVNGIWVYGEELTYSPSLNYPYNGDGLSVTIDKNSYPYNYNRMLKSSDSKIPLLITPSEDTVNVSVSTWTTNSKTWTESSETHDITTSHTIGGFPSNKEVDIYVDGVKLISPISSSTGYITFTYSGGFSEHGFEAIVATDANLMFDSSAGIVTSSVAMVGVVVIVAMVALAIAILKGKAGPELIAPAIIGLLIIMVCIYAMYGVATQIQNAFGY